MIIIFRLWSCWIWEHTRFWPSSHNILSWSISGWLVLPSFAYLSGKGKSYSKCSWQFCL